MQKCMSLELIVEDHLEDQEGYGLCRSGYGGT